MIEGWFDGVCEPKNPGGHAAWGALVRVDNRTVFEAGGYCGVGAKMSNNVAEYSGVCAVLKEVLKYPGIARIYGDSKLVVMQLQRKWKINGGLYMPFHLEAMALWEGEGIKNRATISWIPREKNDVCDHLSKKVLHDMGVEFRIQPE